MSKEIELFNKAREGKLARIKELISEGIPFDTQPTHCRFTAMLNAAVAGKYEVVEYLLQQGARVDAQSRWGDTALHLAASECHLDIVKLLVKFGADINKTNVNGETPLYAAVSKGHLEVVKYLLNRGADREIKNDKGKSLIEVAEAKNRSFIVKTLKEYYPLQEFFDAVDASDRKKIERLLERGIDINYQMSPGNETALIKAALNSKDDPRQTKLIGLLLENGADPKLEDRYGSTALHYVFRRRDTKLLIKHGADVNAEDNEGSTVLHDIVRKSDCETVKYLLEQGANRDIEDIHYRKPSFYAFSNDVNGFSIIKMLREYFPDPIEDKDQEMADANQSNNSPTLTQQFNTFKKEVEDELTALKGEIARLKDDGAEKDEEIRNLRNLIKGKQEVEEHSHTAPTPTLFGKGT